MKDEAQGICTIEMRDVLIDVFPMIPLPFYFHTLLDADDLRGPFCSIAGQSHRMERFFGGATN